ncbi:MAG TPA: hypothetical protein VH134_09660 [Candidatus Dormibacteraeota bacterium]|nr:hypothetical protein [Candidatus Dormibacteraeota bacterium]
MDENAGPVGPSQLPAPPAYPPPPAAPPQGWAASQAPPPPPPPPGWTGQWQAAPAAPLTRAQRGRVWDMVSLGAGAGSLWAGIGGLLLSGFGLLLIRAPITSTHNGTEAVVDHVVGHFILALFGMMFAVGGIGAGGIGGVAGVAGLVTRRASIAALALLGIASGIGAILLGIYSLGQISW